MLAAESSFYLCIFLSHSTMWLAGWLASFAIKDLIGFDALNVMTIRANLFEAGFCGSLLSHAVKQLALCRCDSYLVS